MTPDHIHPGLLSRREMLRRAGAAGLLVAGSGSLLAACGGVEGTDDDSGAGERRQTTANHPKKAFAALTVSNWPLYIDKDQLKSFNGASTRTSSTRRTSTTTTSSSRKVRQELESDRPIGRDLVVLTDWMAGALDRPGFAEPLDKDNVPNATQPRRHAEDARPTTRSAAYTLPWQSGMSAIGYNPKRTGRKLDERQRPLRPEVQGPRLDAAGLARLGRPRDARPGQEDHGRHEGRRPGGDREDRRGEPQGPDPALHRQRLRQGPGLGHAVGVRRLLGRRHPAQGRQPEARVPHPRGGRDPLVGQHAHPQGREAALRGRGVDQLLLRPGQRGEARGVRQLRHAGQGGQGGPRAHGP